MYFFQIAVLTIAASSYALAVGGYGAASRSGNYGGQSGQSSGGFGAAAAGGSYGGSAGAAGSFGSSGGASNYAGGASSYGGSSSFGGASSGFDQGGAPKPYNFDYQAQDEEGNMHYRNEEADASGTVRGTYGYTDNQGLFRVVEYVADANGFRANIRTNEPGTDGKESPADVQMTVDEPPAGLQDRFSSGGGRSGFSGAGSYGAGAGRGAAVGGGAGAGSYSAGAGRGAAVGSGAGAGSYNAGAGAENYGSGASAGSAGGAGLGAGANTGFRGAAQGGFSGGAVGGYSSGGSRGGAGVRSGKSGY